MLTSRAAIQCWDNATRGLDANTALQYTRIMRILSDVTKTTTLVSLYQAGNQIYKYVSMHGTKYLEMFMYLRLQPI